MSYSPSPIRARKIISGSESPVIKQTIQAKSNLKKTNASLRWGAINALGVAILSYDMSLTEEKSRTYFYTVEYILVIILTLNTFYHVCRYIYNRFTLQPVPVTPRQKELLGFKDFDPCYKIMTELSTPDSHLISQTSTPLNTTALSWRSSSPQSDSIYSVSSPSWVYYRGTSESVREDSSTSTPVKIPSIPDTSAIENITDELSLSQYLKEYESHEKMLNISNSQDEPTNILSTFWSHPAAHACNEVSTFLKNSTYQLASQAMEKLTGSPGKGHTDGNASPVTLHQQGMEVWNELRVDLDTLTLWHSNLRMWIYQTILERLISEIKFINESLHRHGFMDVQIGSVGLERLRKTAQTQPALQYIPTMVSLIPFLEASSNQEYLVKRIRELAHGGSMSEYRWNSGGNFNGKTWEDHLPTDAAIVMHLVATYLDTQLVPLSHQPDARPFTTRHIIRGNEKPGPNSASVIIREVTEKPPYYNLVINGKTYEIVKGRNNLFHALLLFLYKQNEIEHGMIGRVNLGKSGVNMLWIIEK